MNQLPNHLQGLYSASKGTHIWIIQGIYFFFIKGPHSQASSTNPKPRRSAGNASTNSHAGSATPPPPGRCAGRAGAHSQAGNISPPQPGRSAGSAGTLCMASSISPPQLGRGAGSAVHKFTKYGLFSNLQACYILIMLIMPHATCDKRQKSAKTLRQILI